MGVESDTVEAEGGTPPSLQSPPSLEKVHPPFTIQSSRLERPTAIYPLFLAIAVILLSPGVFFFYSIAPFCSLWRLIDATTGTSGAQAHSAIGTLEVVWMYSWNLVPSVSYCRNWSGLGLLPDDSQGGPYEVLGAVFF